MKDRSETWRRCRFALGLIGIFLATVELTLGAFAAGAALVPGWSATVVASGSMEPALQRGDVVVYRDGADQVAEVGEIIVFDTGTGSTVHRVIGVNEDGTVVTQGDANRVADSSPVTTDMVDGSGFMVIPWIGYPNLWLIEDQLILLLAFMFISVLLLQSSTLAWDETNSSWIEADASWDAEPRAPRSVAWSLSAPIPEVGASMLSSERRWKLLQHSQACLS